MRYAHTNIVAKDWKALAEFYCSVFDCKPLPPERRQSGAWLDRGTGLKNAKLAGAHLRLPGHGHDGPSLEIYQYADAIPGAKSAPNRIGFGHLAFEVEDIDEVKSRVLMNHGAAIGKTTETVVDGVGKLTFIYMADPEGNILEIQHWD